MDHLDLLSAYLPKWEFRLPVSLSPDSPDRLLGDLREWRIRREESDSESDKIKLHVDLIKMIDGCQLSKFLLMLPF